MRTDPGPDCWAGITLIRGKRIRLDCRQEGRTCGSFVLPKRQKRRTLIDYIAGGDSLDDFLEDFPTGARKQAIAFVEEASKRLLVPA